MNQGGIKKNNRAVGHNNASSKKAQYCYFSFEPVRSEDIETKSLLKRELDRRHMVIRRGQLHDKL